MTDCRGSGSLGRTSGDYRRSRIPLAAVNLSHLARLEAKLPRAPAGRYRRSAAQGTAKTAPATRQNYRKKNSPLPSLRKRCGASCKRPVPRSSRRVTESIDGLALPLEGIHDVQRSHLGRAARGTRRQFTCCEPPMAAAIESNPGSPATRSFRCSSPPDPLCKSMEASSRFACLYARALASSCVLCISRMRLLFLASARTVFRRECSVYVTASRTVASKKPLSTSNEGSATVPPRAAR